MAKRTSVGDEEMKILAFVADHPLCSAADTAKTFADGGLARTTIQTVLERLRQKGLIEREQVDGTWRYSSVYSREDVQRGALKDFLRRILGKPSSPLLAYLSGEAQLEEEDLKQLRSLLDHIDDEGPK